MNGDSSTKLEKIKENIKQMGSVAIAFSGGVDSTFLSKISYDLLGKNAVAITAISATFPKRELDQTRKIAKTIGIRHLFITTEETESKAFMNNPINRCYLCKKELFSKIKTIAKQENLAHVLDGSNVEDIGDYRPGMKALSELGIVSPLLEAKFTKQEIRELSKELNLETWNKPAYACLASRFPYGEEITASKLNRVEKAESYLFTLGIEQLRVRYHDTIARVEVSNEDVHNILLHSKDIIKRFKELGFEYITLDLEGYRTGSLNEVLE